MKKKIYTPTVKSVAHPFTTFKPAKVRPN